ncbi:MAG: phosphotransferase [Pseudanabaena frigida]|uniref:Phosphotransferase n=1 Tax=Pseudanabaena frigida TaxID=945775 RepID=A0A2W4WJR1_9CYAN|nr:MAG: phosphotransferase [Pseudanabaena frigida]
MDQDKQKQITMYFIEEAKEHLQTIESGLLDLQSLMGNTESVNEIFRAAHSIKGGAAMLGFSSIQHVAHNFEDYFKVMRENTNFQVDQHLQTLFLQAFDKLQELVELLQSPYGLTKDAVDGIMAGSDQIFANLKAHLQNLISGKQTETKTQVMPKATAKATNKPDTRVMLGVFQSEVPLKLRNMLELFKQPDSPRSRQNLEGICSQLQEIGDRFGLEPWTTMVQSVSAAVSNPNNQFRVLAPILIKEIKQAQEQVLAQRANDIRASQQLLQLISADISGKLSTPKVAVGATTGSSGNTSSDEVSKIFGAVIEEDKAMKGWQTFGDRVGWKQNGSWITSNTIQSQPAPDGHFPTPLWLAAWHQTKDTKAKEFQSQYATLLAKIASCNLP